MIKIYVYLQPRLNNFIVYYIEIEVNNIDLKKEAVDIFSKLKNPQYHLI